MPRAGATLVPPVPSSWLGWWVRTWLGGPALMAPSWPPSTTGLLPFYSQRNGKQRDLVVNAGHTLCLQQSWAGTANLKYVSWVTLRGQSSGSPSDKHFLSASHNRDVVSFGC